MEKTIAVYSKTDQLITEAIEKVLEARQAADPRLEYQSIIFTG